MRKRKDKNEKDDVVVLNTAISDLFITYNREYGSIEKFKEGKNLVIVARTGGWFDNEEAITKFNKTKFGNIATIEWWFLQEWKRGGYFKWEIPLFLIRGSNTKVIK